MSIILEIEVPENRNRGQGMPVDFLIEKCIEHTIHDIDSMFNFWELFIFDTKSNVIIKVLETDDIVTIVENRCKFLKDNDWMKENLAEGQVLQIRSTNKWQLDVN